MNDLIIYGKDGEIETLSDSERRIGRANNVVVSIRRKFGTLTRWHVVLTPAKPGELTVNTTNVSHLIRLLEKARRDVYGLNNGSEPLDMAFPDIGK